MRRIAAAPAAFGTVPPGFERILDERFCLFFGANRVFTSVFPFRLREVAADLEEVRQEARARGVSRVEWWIASETEPAGLAQALRDLGLREHEDSHVQAMALLEAPPAAGSLVVARRVRCPEELRLATEISLTAFGETGPRREAALANVADEWERREGVHSATFLAFEGDRAVGAGRSAYLETAAVLLVGGSVLPDARGRGAYRALVRARWDDAVARGTPALLVHAGRMSRPILERAGFLPVLELEILVDELAGLAGAAT